MNGIQDQVHQEGTEFSGPCDHHHRTWDEQEVLSLNRDTFDSDKHLAFSPPEWTRNLADMELDDGIGTSSFAVSGDFSLFSAAAVEQMVEELITEEVRHTFQKNGSIRGIVPEYVQHPRRGDNTDQIVHQIR
jgi:hypothetical protein